MSAPLRPRSALARVGVAATILAAVLLAPLPAAGGWLWDMAQTAGYLALLLAAILFLYPLRPRPLRREGVLSLTLHRRLGWTALAFAAGHAALLLVREPHTVRYLYVSAPLYMLAGTMALLALAVLVWSGLTVRTGMRTATRAPRRQAAPAPGAALLHGVLSAALLGLLAAHVIGSGELTDVAVKRVVLCVELVLVLLAWACVRRGGANRGRWSLVTSIAAVTGGALLLLPTTPARSRLLEPAIGPPERLGIDFPHARHLTVNCVECHHNFVDATGTGSCIDCHRSARPDLEHSSEATFHVFCRECHAGLARATAKHGPTRACSGCHP